MPNTVVSRPLSAVSFAFCVQLPVSNHSLKLLRGRCRPNSSVLSHTPLWAACRGPVPSRSACPASSPWPACPRRVQIRVSVSRSAVSVSSACIQVTCILLNGPKAIHVTSITMHGSLLSLTVPTVQRRCVCTARNGLCRVRCHLGFQAATGGLGAFPLRSRRIIVN